MAGDRTSPDDGECPHQVERNVTLPYVPSSVTGARKLLQDDLAGLGLGEERLDDAALVLSELVSNALRHATPLPAPREGSVGVSWRAEFGQGQDSSGWVELSVRDGGSSTMPRVARPSVSGLGGRGLGIVQALAGRWGTEMDSDTTTVWAVMEVAGDDFAPDRAAVVAEAVEGLHTDISGGDPVVEFPMGVPGDSPVRSAVL
ncbi:ATP-binding protein [Nocardiopsis kunsanensis]|uniref:ATP-binding protein n=1 Tax=Nocardiopsis kunsanensis TaxID=141693 RepID=UPI00034C1EB9|nr:ATP-binding protein [Nocardiopsis kunsanensis]